MFEIQFKVKCKGVRGTTMIPCFRRAVLRQEGRDGKKKGGKKREEAKW